MNSLTIMCKILILVCSISIITGCVENTKSETEPQSQTEIESPKTQSVLTNQCEIDKFLNSSDIIKEAKQIWLEEIQPMDDDPTFKVLDRINNSPLPEFPFYILVVDKINRASDGALSEMIMSSSYNLINNRTKEFFSTFQPLNCLLKSQGLNHPSSFAQAYGGYLSLDCDGAPTTEEYENCTENQIEELKQKCVLCDMTNFLIALKGRL
ncbi:MAG: hypothetical protein AAGF85_13145 [Bacteroidota bacterium]